MLTQLSKWSSLTPDLKVEKGMGGRVGGGSQWITQFAYSDYLYKWSPIAWMMGVAVP